MNGSAIEISEAPIARVSELRVVPISFTVDRPGATPWVKNYDDMPGEGPTQWARRFDISKWGFFQARSKHGLVGGAVIAFDTPDLAMLEGRRDLAVLWDIRVVPDLRRQGVGSRLLCAAEAWAVSKGCRELKVETQDINVTACRFYERNGFVLRSTNRAAYAELPDEIQLLWCKDL